MALTLAEQMLFTTVKLTGLVGGKEKGTGTGFFWRVDEGIGYVIVLVTNKHVISGCDEVRAVCHTCSPGQREVPLAQTITVTMALDRDGLFEHPKGDVDLVAFGFSELIDKAEARGTPIFFRSINADNVPSVETWADFDAIEDVIMIGYPRGISDEVNNRPIVRRGITATALGLNYNGKLEFLVDMACFPGSSGSPVFINQLGYVDRHTGSYMIDGRRFYFLGVLYAGPMITQTGEIRLGAAPIVEVAAMMHLGQVIKSMQLLKIDDMIRSKLPPAPQAPALS